MASAPCQYRDAWGGRPALAPLKEAAIHALIPLVRALTRYAPSARAQAALWTRVVRPYFAWHAHGFTARTTFGARLAGDTQEVLEQSIYYFGVWEPNLSGWMSERLRPGDVFIDVGANVGYFSLLGSRCVGEAGYVVAIEASPANFSTLRANLDRNRARNVRAVNVAASDHRATVKLFGGPSSHTGLASVLAEQGAGVEGEVESAPLGELVTRSEWERTRLVKIDVEGAEGLVVAGLAGLLEDAPADLELVVEVHPGNGERVVPALEAAGFHPYRIEIAYPPLHPGVSRPRPFRVERSAEADDHLIFSRRDTDKL